MTSSSDTAISSAMASAISRIMDVPSRTEFNINVVLASGVDPKYTYTPLFIDEMEILQSFSDCFADEVKIKFTVTPQEYIDLFNHMKNLILNMTIIYVDTQNSIRVYDPPPVVRKYRAILKNPQNILKKYTPGALTPTANQSQTEQHVATRMDVELQLVEYDLDIIRHRKFNASFVKTDIKGIINYAAKTFQIERLYLVTPDNKHVWGNLVIPPVKDLENIFYYLQVHHGVYGKGIEFYYTDKTLYIYPPYETNPVIPYIANIYNASKGAYTGARSFHQINGATLDIVSTTGVETKDLSVSRAENEGTSSSFMRASRLIDGFTKTTRTGTHIVKNNTLTIGGVNSRTIAHNSNNDKYQRVTDNIFMASTKIAEGNATLVRCGWNQAVPFILKPGHAVRYVFDDNGILKKKTGILEVVQYKMQLQRRLDIGHVYSCAATMRFRVGSDQDN